MQRVDNPKPWDSRFEVFGCVVQVVYGLGKKHLSSVLRSSFTRSLSTRVLNFQLVE